MSDSVIQLDRQPRRWTNSAPGPAPTPGPHTRKIVIAGSEGLIGRSITHYFRGLDDCEVVAIDLALGHDLSDESQVEAIFDEHSDAQYLINLFALNHHVEPGMDDPDLFEMSLESFRKYCEVNLVALFSVCREFARRCEKPEGILNFASLYGARAPKHFLYEGGGKHIGYTATKHGVVGLTRHLATYLAPEIRVNCLIPGGVEAGQPESFKAAYSSNTPAGRMMRADELSGIIDFLCSDKASYMTGTSIPVDGGWTAW
jgi:NAD(P)-dependent dehydrogenase (short-subunit alcohol dehydrogenase family)